jgi:acetolactate synthase I/III small subunit
MKAHTFVVTVEDQPGVLNRVASLFRRRGYNIESLTVGRTERPGISRMTVVVMSDDAGAGRLEANLYKLVHVISVSDITSAPAVYRDLAIIKVAASQACRPELVHLVEVFRARIVDVAPDSLTIEITGGEDKIDGLLEVLRPYGVLEMARTGRVAMARGTRVPNGTSEPVLRPPEEDFQISYSV